MSEIVVHIEYGDHRVTLRGQDRQAIADDLPTAWRALWDEAHPEEFRIMLMQMKKLAGVEQ